MKPEQPGFQKALDNAFKNLYMILPMLLAVIGLVGLFQTFVTPQMLRSLFSGSPLYDTLIGTFTGGVSVGQPFLSYIIGGELLKEGISLYAVTAFIISFVTLGLVNLDWTPDEIVENMLHESQFYEELNAIYAMSTHTHLMNFSTNISMLEHYFKYLQNNTAMRSMNGEMIYERITAMQKIIISAKSDLQAVTVKVTNQNDRRIKNYTFRLYSMQHAIKTVSADQKSAALKMHQVRDGIYDITVAELQPSSQLVLHAQYQP